METTLNQRIAHRLRSLRAERNWSLDDLAAASGVSRATLSRLENAEVSPTAAVLGKLCAAFGLPLSRLMLMIENAAVPLVRREDQPVWTDATTGFTRRSVSPPNSALTGEVIAGDLGPGVRIAYERPPRPGLEHHIVLQEGSLSVTVDGVTHGLAPGDCLRYRLFGPSLFETPPESGARYFIFIV